MQAITILTKEDLGIEDRGWTRGHVTCSFDDYPKHLPGYLELGDLRLAVLQEIDPKAGYPMHPHANSETITLVLNGAMTHEDDFGSPPEIVGANGVAVLSSGTGMKHAEMVHGDEKARAVMFWLSCEQKGQAPRFVHRTFDRVRRKNQLVTVASGRSGAPDGTLDLRHDSEVRTAALDPSKVVSHEIDRGRAVYVITTDGAVDVGGRRIEAGERLIARGPRTLAISAVEATEVVLLDLPLVTEVVTS